MRQSFQLIAALILTLSDNIGTGYKQIDEGIDEGVCKEELYSSEKEGWDMCRGTFKTTTRDSYTTNATNTTISEFNNYANPIQFNRMSTKYDDCACDHDCNAYSDCCADAITNVNTTVINELIGFRDCIELRSEGSVYSSVYGVSHCNYSWFSWRKSVEIAEKCELDSNKLKTLGKDYSYLQDIAVYSKSSYVMYANIFCAICNFDSSQLEVWNADMNCNGSEPMVTAYYEQLTNNNYDTSLKFWAFKRNNEYINCYLTVVENRFLATNYYGDCKTLIKHCAKYWRDISVAHKCYFYASYVYENDETTGYTVKTYNNYHCAQCNNVSTILSCIEKRPPTQHASGIETYHSLSLLLNFNFADDIDEWVGVDYKCPKFGQLYDPNKQKCVNVFCEAEHWKNSLTGECVNADNSGDNNYFFENSVHLNCTNTDILTESIDFVVLNNNSLLLNLTNTLLSEAEYELSKQVNESDKRKAKVCVEEHVYLLTDYNAYGQLILREISLIISIVCLTLHIIVYTILPNLLDLPAKNLLSLAISILVAHLFFIIKSYVTARRNIVCVLIAIITHYSYLASFCWMSVIAFDIYRTFRRATQRSISSKRNTFLKYSLYAWLLPCLVVIIAATFDIGLQQSVWRPLYGYSVCWISQRRALLMFFALPIALVMLLNLTLFALTAIVMRKNAKQTKMFRTNSSDLVRYFLYIKLASVMGLTWIFGLIATLTKISWLWYPFIIFKGLQGAIILFAFTCKREIWQQLVVRCGFKAGFVRPSKSATSSDIIRSGTASTTA